MSDWLTVPEAAEYCRCSLRAFLNALYGCERGPLWRFMVNTGLRRAEMAKARRNDIRDGQIVVESTAEGRTKSGKWRAVPLNSEARAAGCEHWVDGEVPF